jgi:hypothetical protein
MVERSATEDTMRIGFIGNVAGAMYTFARCFRALGYEAYYLHLPSSHAFTDPAWEDGNAFVPYHELQHQRTLRRLRRTWVAGAGYPYFSCWQLVFAQ